MTREPHEIADSAGVGVTERLGAWAIFHSVGDGSTVRVVDFEAEMVRAVLMGIALAHHAPEYSAALNAWSHAQTRALNPGR